MKKFRILYIFIILLVLLIPFVLMPAAGSSWSTQTTALAERPALKTEEGKVNLSYLSDAGAWFEDHFAFRSALVTGNSLLQQKIFRTSSTDQVITGKNGWLYFNGTLPDYQRTNTLSARALYNAAHNLKLIRDYYDLLGIRFIVTIAPNKNSLYPENLPYYILPGEGESNAEAFAKALEAEGICYADLFSALDGADTCLYYAQDTHWNEKGAAIAFDTIMKETGRTEWEDYSELSYDIVRDHSGDLAEMLVPEAVSYEESVAWNKKWGFEFTEPVEDCMDEFIQTESIENNGGLYMFRDSFGSALIPLFADEYQTAEFSRLTPYKIADPVLYKADTVVIERAERNIHSFAEEAPLMQNPVREEKEAQPVQTITTCNFGTNGGYYVIKGAVDPEYCSEDTQIYAEVTMEGSGGKKVYEAFYLSAEREDGSTWDSLYQINILKNEEDSTGMRVRVLTEDNGTVLCVAEKEFDLGKG